MATAAEDEYLQTIYWLEEAELPMTGANIARAMHVSAPTVHEMVGRLEADGFIKLGSLMNMKTQWNSLSLYGFLAYVLTGLPSGIESRDRMVLLAGVSLPIAPWKK